MALERAPRATYAPTHTQSWRVRVARWSRWGATSAMRDGTGTTTDHRQQANRRTALGAAVQEQERVQGLGHEKMRVLKPEQVQEQDQDEVPGGSGSNNRS